jgi:hypothetical protein
VAVPVAVGSSGEVEGKAEDFSVGVGLDDDGVPGSASCGTAGTMVWSGRGGWRNSCSPPRTVWL